MSACCEETNSIMPTSSLCAAQVNNCQWYSNIYNWTWSRQPRSLQHHSDFSLFRLTLSCRIQSASDSPLRQPLEADQRRKQKLHHCGTGCYIEQSQGVKKKHWMWKEASLWNKLKSLLVLFLAPADYFILSYLNCCFFVLKVKYSLLGQIAFFILAENLFFF